MGGKSDKPDKPEKKRSDPLFFRSVLSKLARNHETIDLDQAATPPTLCSASSISLAIRTAPLFQDADEPSRGFGRPNKSGTSGTSGRASDGPSAPSSPGPNTSIGSPVNTSIPPVPASPGPSSVLSFGSEADSQPERKQPYFFREEYSSLIVKGNFMTLAAKPVHVEEGEWLAHQVVEQYRLLDGMIRIIKTVNEKTGQPICNPTSCPTMSAAGHTYTWLDNQKRPIKIPACQYILLVQKWIEGKFDDRTLFPIDNNLPPSLSGASTPGSKDWLGRSSAFPESFESDVRSIYRQMMRCYAHIYYGHWLEPFWDLDSTKFLNTCFIHFVNVGRTFSILSERDMEPMGALIQLWEGKGLLPKKEGATVAGAPAPTAVPAAG